MKALVLKMVLSIMFPNAEAYSFQDQDIVYNVVLQQGYPRKIQKINENIWFLYSSKIYEMTPAGDIATCYVKKDTTWIQNK